MRVTVDDSVRFLPSPRVKSVSEFEYEYRSKLKDDESANRLKKVLLEGGSLRRFVVATPVLSTESVKIVKQYLVEYCREASQFFTVVLYVNGSSRVDPGWVGREAILDLCEKFKVQHPLFDLRVLESPRDDTVYNIGAVRKQLWDAVYLAAVDSFFPYSPPPLDEGEDEDVAVSLEWLSKNYSETFIFNHDVDVVKLPHNYLLNIVCKAINYDLFYKGKYGDRYFHSYGSPVRHAWSFEHPNISTVYTIHDYLCMSRETPFEAGLIVRASTYAALGGFDEGSVTYEVAGLVNRVQSSNLWVNQSPMLTSPRRLLQKFHYTDMAGVWRTGDKVGDPVFGESDACRDVDFVESFDDISDERRDQLIVKQFEEDGLGSVIVYGCIIKTIRSGKKGRVAYNAFKKLAESDSLNIVDAEQCWDVLQESYTKVFNKMLRVLRYIIERSGSQTWEVVEPLIVTKFEEALKLERETMISKAVSNCSK